MMRMIKELDRGSLNLELALLIMLLALAIVFGLTWMGGGIANQYNAATDWLLGGGGGRAPTGGGPAPTLVDNGDGTTTVTFTDGSGDYTVLSDGGYDPGSNSPIVITTPPPGSAVTVRDNITGDQTDPAVFPGVKTYDTWKVTVAYDGVVKYVRNISSETGNPPTLPSFAIVFGSLIMGDSPGNAPYTYRIAATDGTVEPSLMAPADGVSSLSGFSAGEWNDHWDHTLAPTDIPALFPGLTATLMGGNTVDISIPDATEADGTTYDMLGVVSSYEVHPAASNPDSYSFVVDNGGFQSAAPRLIKAGGSQEAVQFTPLLGVPEAYLRSSNMTLCFAKNSGYTDRENASRSYDPNKNSSTYNHAFGVGNVGQLNNYPYDNVPGNVRHPGSGYYTNYVNQVYGNATTDGTLPPAEGEFRVVGDPYVQPAGNLENTKVNDVPAGTADTIGEHTITVTRVKGDYPVPLEPNDVSLSMD